MRKYKSGAAFRQALEDREPERIPGTGRLQFAGIEPIEVPVLPLEQHVAEKVHAYSRIYSGGRASSRVKDLIDIVLIKQPRALDATCVLKIHSRI